MPAAQASQHVLADYQRLRQVLLNLLSNAVKYNRPDGTVTVAVEPRPGDRLRINVADTGRGISQPSLAKLFTPFERLDAAQAGIEGTGLGLVMCRELVQAMHGETGATSIEGRGSTFWAELPESRAGNRSRIYSRIAARWGRRIFARAPARRPAWRCGRHPHLRYGQDGAVHRRRSRELAAGRAGAETAPFRDPARVRVGRGRARPGPRVPSRPESCWMCTCLT